jgi:hypothetical protein
VDNLVGLKENVIIGRLIPVEGGEFMAEAQREVVEEVVEEQPVENEKVDEKVADVTTTA